MTKNETTSLVKTEQQGGAIERWGATTDQLNLLKATIAKGTTDDEFALFMTVAQRQGLDPFLRQIHAVRRWDQDSGQMVMQIQTGIDGYRLMAERSGVYGGLEGPWWCGEDGQWVDVWLAKIAPAAAKVIVHRTDKRRPFVAVALWTSYAQTKKDGTLTAMWRRHGPGQLAKCAEALAFRRAFPIEIGGATHVDAEMDGDFIEAEAVEAPKFTAPPPPQGPPPGVPRETRAVGVDGPVGTVTPGAPVSSAGMPDPAQRVTAAVAEVDRKLAERGLPTTVSDSALARSAKKNGNAERPTTAPAGAASSETSKTSPTNSAPTGSPATSPSTSSGAGTAADPFQGAREAVEQRDKWGQKIGDPTSAGGGPAPQSSGTSTYETPSTASTESDGSVGPQHTPRELAADDGFGEDPVDSQPVPTGDPGMQLIEDMKAFLTGCKTQTQMQEGRPPFAQRADALCQAGDERFRAKASADKPVGEMSKLLGKLWAERKAQLPV